MIEALDSFEERGPTPTAALHELALRLAGVTEGEPR
jgi:hypothetical protein